ncbi:nitrite reductase (NAD(P)H) small subunit [Brevibacillus migulae]|uniref:nitrite reductase (NAD(P)H) small subunit n=1 Tax=Brevibacillus migulae TaxID=1644114 RepID=UPI002E26346E
MYRHRYEHPFLYVEVGQRDDFPSQLGRQIVIGQYDIALFHTSDDRFYALDNHTPHPKGGPLTEGMVSSHYVYCPLRDLKINLIDGLVQEPGRGKSLDLSSPTRRRSGADRHPASKLE